MTERKPRQQSFPSWIDQQIADAENRGVFDNLPGTGKPLNIKPTGDGDFGQAWMRDYARREGVSPGEFLPTPLKLRREIEQLAETVGEMRSEAEVRETFGDLNRRIVEWRRIPVGPPIHVRLVNTDEMVARWRAAQTAKEAQAAERAHPAAEAQAAPQQTARPVRRRSWLRHLRRRPPRSAQLATNRSDADNSKKRGRADEGRSDAADPADRRPAEHDRVLDLGVLDHAVRTARNSSVSWVMPPTRIPNAEPSPTAASIAGAVSPITRP